MHINNASALCLLYERAVFGLAKANLSERFRDIDTQALGHKKPTVCRRRLMIAGAMPSGQSHELKSRVITWWH